MGHSTYPNVKTGGNKSMSKKQESLEDAEGVVLRGPRDKAKAELPESQSPAAEMHARCYSVCNATSPGVNRSAFAVCCLRLVERWRTTPFKGMSGAPTSRLIRSQPTERGIA